MPCDALLETVCRLVPATAAALIPCSASLEHGQPARPSRHSHGCRVVFYDLLATKPAHSAACRCFAPQIHECPQQPLWRACSTASQPVPRCPHRPLLPQEAAEKLLPSAAASTSFQQHVRNVSIIFRRPQRHRQLQQPSLAQRVIQQRQALEQQLSIAE